MSFVSYAQNFEDVLLWRALSHVPNGFYIDVGANDPVEFSVTKAFYDAGWRGINIEPLAAFHALFMEQRPRDINLAVAAGAEEGEVVLFDVPAVNGWASSSPDVAAMHRAEGYEVVEQRVPLRTLDAIWREHVTGPVHFLKIDVEGFEEQVLRGLNLKNARPWVLVIEATTPNSRETNHETWEHLVTDNAYLFAYFDGLNRYYVAAEHADLLGRLQVQVNVFDDAITARLRQALDDKAILLARLEAIEAAAAEPAPERSAGPGADEALRGAIDWLEQRVTGTDKAMTELWNNALPSITEQLTTLERRITQVRSDASAETHARTAGVEQRIAATEQRIAGIEHRMAGAEQRVAEASRDSAEAMHHVAETDRRFAETEQRLAGVEARQAESEQRAAALAEQMSKHLASFDDLATQGWADVHARLADIAQRSDQRSAALESQLTLTEQRIDPLAGRLQEADRRLTSAEEFAGQANRRATDAETASAVSTSQLGMAEQRAELLEQHVNSLLASSSWRITAPLRAVGGIVWRVRSAAREGRLISGMRRRAVQLLRGPAAPDTASSEPSLIAATPPLTPTGDLFIPEWQGPLPAEYMVMPVSSRTVLLDLARTSVLPPEPTTPFHS